MSLLDSHDGKLLPIVFELNADNPAAPPPGQCHRFQIDLPHSLMHLQPSSPTTFLSPSYSGAEKEIPRMASAAAAAHREARNRDIEAASYGRDSSPVALSRLSGELWPLITNEDWSLVGWQGFIGNWPNRLRKFDRPYQYIGGQGVGGIGCNARPRWALANKKHGRLSISKPTAA
jgi:hypothetical protein